MATKKSQPMSGEAVNQHKRMAMGQPVSGQTMAAKGNSKPAAGLSALSKQK